MNRIFVVILFLSCTAFIKTKPNRVAIAENKYLYFLENYKSSIDSKGDRIITEYNKLNLVKETKNKECLIKLRNKKVFSGDYGKCSYLMEVYNGTHLLISCVEGKSFSAGPDTFERDSIIIVDLVNGTSNMVSLPKTYLTRSSDFLFKAYNCPNDTFKYKRGYRYCAIDSVDLVNHKLLLINQCHQKEFFLIRNY